MATTVLIKEIQNSDKLTLEKLKKKIKDDICYTPTRHFKSLTNYTCLLPSLQHFPQDFIQEIKKKTLLLDDQIQNVLEESFSINWCAEVTKLSPLSVKGDGNCLAHAVSLALWGIDDSDLILRKLIYEEITTDRLQTFKQRWKRYCCIQAEEIGGVLLSSTDWNSEWTNEVELTCCIKQDDISNLPYSSLGDIHTFILANIIRRPIIVIGDDVIRNFDGNTLACNKLVGVYLPLLWKPEECVHNPILLGYDQNHYVPLVTTEIDMVLTVPHNLRAIPLVKIDLTPLTPHLLTYDEENKIDRLYRQYFHLIEVPYIKNGEHIYILAAKLGEETLPDDLNLMEVFFKKNERIYRNLLEAGSSSSDDILGKEVKHSDDSKDLRKASLSLSPSRQMANPTEKLQKLLVRKTSDQINPEEFSEVFTSVGPITCNYQKCITEFCPNFQSFYTEPYCHECNDKAFEVIPKNPLLRTYSEGSSKKSPTQQNRKKGVFNFNPNFEMGERIYKGYNQFPHLGKVLETNLEIQPTKIKALSEEQLPCTSFFFCKTVDCTFGTTSENDVYCSQCSKLNAQSTFSEAAQNPPSEHSFSHLSLSDPVNPGPPPDTLIKYLCVTPGCDGLRSPNPLGMCYYCYKKNVKSGRKVSPSSSRPKLKRRLSKCIFPCCTNCTFSESFVCQQCYNLCCLIMDPSVTISNQPSPKDNKMRLTSQVSPGLGDPTTPILRHQKAETYPPRRPFQNDLAAGGNNVRLEKGEPCRNPSCSLFGRSETMNFCSQCFYKYLEDQTYSSTFQLARNKPDIIYIQRKNQSDPPASFVFSDPVQKQKISCVADAGCRNFGNLETQGLCTTCYEKFLKLTLPKKDGSDFLLHVIQDCVKQDTGKCLSTFCNNRGNRKCNGYCNNCNYHILPSQH